MHKIFNYLANNLPSLKHRTKVRYAQMYYMQYKRRFLTVIKKTILPPALHERG